MKIAQKIFLALIIILNKGYSQNISIATDNELIVQPNPSFSSVSGTDPSPALFPPCDPSATNDDCSSAVLLNPGSACTNGTLCNSTIQSGELSTIGSTAITNSVWYTFRASASSMYVDMNQLSGSCFIAFAVYGPFGNETSGCLPVLSSRIAYVNASSSPIQKILDINGLATGQYYMIQVGYEGGGSCGTNGNAAFCINVNTPLNCPTCPSPCGATKGYTTPPASYEQLKNDGACYPMRAPNDTIQKCYTFTSWDDSVSVAAGFYVTGGCGNATSRQFSLYSNSCTSTSVNSNGLFTALIPGENYTICYYYILESGCNVDTLCPYYRQTNIESFPVELLDFTAKSDEGKIICKWTTASEINNDYFEIQRKEEDVGEWKIVGTVKGAGNSSSIRNYEFVDAETPPGYSLPATRYYRLKQTDFNGKFSFSKIVSVIYKEKYSVEIFPNPFKSSIKALFNQEIKDKVYISIEDVFGRNVFRNTITTKIPISSLEMDIGFLREGIYLVKFNNETMQFHYTIVKLD